MVLSRPDRLNVRIYGLYIKDQSVLYCRERYGDKWMTKFPGGGLELGEGTIDALKREFSEEWGVSIEVKSHFYTTDFFQPSFFDRSQVLSIYYLIDLDPDWLETQWEQLDPVPMWLPLEASYVESLDLPIDRICFNALIQKFNNLSTSPNEPLIK